MIKLTNQELEETFAGSIIEEIFEGVKLLFEGGAMLKGFLSHSGEVKGPDGIDVKFGTSKGNTINNTTQIVFPHIYID